MTERMIVNRVRKLKELEAQQKEIEEQIEALKAEIKADMQRKDLEEQKLISRDGWNIVMTWEQYRKIRELVRVQINETGE